MVIRRAELFSALAAELTELGFRTWRSSEEYVRDLGEGVEGWCSFPSVKVRGEPALRVATVVGVRFAEVESRIARWCGEPVAGGDPRSYVATVALNVGYLTSSNRWQDRRVELTGESARLAVHPLVADVADVVPRFLRTGATYAGLIGWLRRGSGRLDSRLMERLPLAYALGGDRTAAYAALADMRRKVDEASAMSVRYLRYIEGFEVEFPRPTGAGAS